MRLNLLIVFILIQSNLLFSQVGIGTTNPTEEIDINGNARIRGLSNTTGKTVAVSATPDGTLVTSNTSSSTLGIRFVGFLNNDILLDDTTTFFEIPLNNELIDILNDLFFLSKRIVLSHLKSLSIYSLYRHLSELLLAK